MEEKFYTIDQIAEILGMHHKTIRKFITEGKLRANKVGKQWRISGHDLSLFMEDNNVNINGNKYSVCYYPLKNGNKIVGYVFVGVNQERLIHTLSRMRF